MAGTEIRRRLERGEIFREGTWDPQRIRPASYDLRVARDLLFISGSAGSFKYPLGKPRADSVVLEPGDTALFSTKEKCCFPWDLGVYISPKWGLARQGLLIFSGGFISPGFGLELSGRHWVPAEDERLHFFVANVGDRQRAITRDEAIASLTFMQVSGNVAREPVESSQTLIAENYDEDGSLVGLGLINDIAEQRQAAERIEQRVGDIEKGLQPLISFGVYVVGAAMLGVVATVMVGFLSTDSIRKALETSQTNWSLTVSVFLVLVTSLIAMRMLFGFVNEVWQTARAEKRSKKRVRKPRRPTWPLSGPLRHQDEPPS